MTTTPWIARVVSALLALALLVGALLGIAEIVAAALDRSPALVSYPQWADWLRTHSWDDWAVKAILIALIVVGLLLLILAFRRGKPGTLSLRGGSPGVRITARRRSVEKTLAHAATRTTGVSEASAKVGRRTARIEARTLSRSDQNLRSEVESAVKARLDSLGLERPLRTHVKIATRD